MPEPKLLRLSIAAKRCDVCVRTLKRWLKRGELQGVRGAGGHWRIPETEILRHTHISGTNEDSTYYP